MGSDLGSFFWGGVLGQIFLEYPSPLSLLLLRLHDVSIGVISEDSGDFLVWDRSEDFGADSDGSFASDAGTGADDTGTGAGVFRSSGSLAGLGGSPFFLLRVTSVQPSSFGLWAGPGSLFSASFSLVDCLGLVGAVVWFFRGQSFEMWPNCLQRQQRGLLSSTITIICLSLLTIVSGMAWEPSLFRQIRNT